MPRPRPKSQLLHRRDRVVTARDEAEEDEPIYFPYAQCLCDLSDYNNKIPECSKCSKRKTEARSIAEATALPHSQHEEERSKGREPAILSFREYEAKMKSLGSKRGTGSYGVSEEGKQKSKSKIQEADSRRQRKVVKRTQDTKEKTESMKAANPSLKLIAQCSCYDTLSHAQAEIYREKLRGKMRHVRHTHTDGTITFHLSTCVLNGASSTLPFKRYIDTARRMKMDKQEKRMEKLERKEHAWRQSEEAIRLLGPLDYSAYSSSEEYGTHPSHHKSVAFPRNPPKKAPSQAKSEAYIDLEEEEEAGAAEPISPPARQYDQMTIASDFLRVIGQHPYLPPLNSRLKGSYTKKRAPTSR